MRSIVAATLCLGACTSVSAPPGVDGYDSVRDRLASSQTRLRVPSTQGAGSITASRYTPDGWQPGTAVLSVASGELVASVATIYSRAIYAASTPGGKNPLGVEIDPTLGWESSDGFAAVFEHAVLFPLAGLDNPAAGMRAKPAQRFLLRLQYRF